MRRLLLAGTLTLLAFTVSTACETHRDRNGNTHVEVKDDLTAHKVGQETGKAVKSVSNGLNDAANGFKQGIGGSGDAKATDRH